MSVASLDSKKGQTLIEFALVSVLFIFLLVLTFNAILAFAVQQYFSYAAFMSARAYQASSETPQEQRDRSRRILSQFIPGLPVQGDQFPSPGLPIQFSLLPKPIAFIESIQIPNPSNGDYGPGAPQPPKAVRIIFNLPLAQIPLSDTIRQRLGLIRLEAQSFLGREVSASECRSFFRGFLNAYRISGAPPNHQNFMGNPSSGLFMEDNGC